jgi:hypothetical protein
VIQCKFLFKKTSLRRILSQDHICSFISPVFVFEVATGQSKHDLSIANDEKVTVTLIAYSAKWRSFEECREIWKIRALR